MVTKSLLIQEIIGLVSTTNTITDQIVVQDLWYPWYGAKSSRTVGTDRTVCINTRDKRLE